MASAPPNPDMLRVRAERLGLFDTPVLHGQVADAAALNTALGEAIRAQMAAEPGIGRSNVGGWHSKTDMLAWGGEPAARLADAAIRVAKRLSHFDGHDPAKLHWWTRMWANVLHPGGLNMSHAHPGVLWAAVYYVDAGEPDSGGDLFLEDPRFPVPLMTFPGFRMLGPDGQPQEVEHRLTVSPGDLILFPGYMRHGVSPHRGTRDRISVAMNLYVKDPQA
ncbi:TIGR02466 family protein [Sphingomonas sp.]|uniref:TIGR02466 family protein n=1 Tax=Sphingomonas sp. TaxID=28214 RepID=UPI001B16760C|nr:TIGR02466 family protein [Sphingomonas sp.]MBO9714177.1 hypothetical protein [Sphingomonas sp.]